MTFGTFRTLAPKNAFVFASEREKKPNEHRICLYYVALRQRVTFELRSAFARSFVRLYTFTDVITQFVPPPPPLQPPSSRPSDEAKFPNKQKRKMSKWTRAKRDPLTTNRRNNNGHEEVIHHLPRLLLLRYQGSHASFLMTTTIVVVSIIILIRIIAITITVELPLALETMGSLFRLNAEIKRC